MKRSNSIAVALLCAAMSQGCGEGSKTDSSINPQEQAGAGGVAGAFQGAAATGSTWAPVDLNAGMNGGAGFGNPQGGTGAAGMGAGVGGVGAAGTGTGGTGAAGTGAGGMGEAGTGTGGMMAAGTGGTPSVGDASPTIPAVTAQCPDFRDGTITFMGLGGITMVAGAKPAGPTAPMVFYWHGTGSVAGEYAGSAAAVAAGVRAEGGVLISFQGSTGGDFLSGTSVFGAGDFELVDQLVACAVQDHNVDPRRIFTTGCSAGGLFATAMAAMRSNYVAAAAPNSGGLTFPVQFQGPYTPPLMTIHGAAGVDVVFIDFSDSSRTADMTFKNRGGFVINCDHGGRHCGGGPLSGDIWEFFKAHPYGVDPNPWTGGLPSGFNSACEIF